MSTGMAAVGYHVFNPMIHIMVPLEVFTTSWNALSKLLLTNPTANYVLEDSRNEFIYIGG